MYKERRTRLASWMEQAGLDLLVLEDEESRRNLGLRYLSGHPMDGLFFLYRDGSSLLMPWDENLAKERAQVDEVISYNAQGRDLITGVLAGIRHFSPRGVKTVEINPGLPHPLYEKLTAALGRELPGATLFCRSGGFKEEIDRLRFRKDPGELAIYREAAALTNQVLGRLEALLTGAISPPAAAGLTEADVALFIERESRLLGAEGTSFETIAAGPGRSWGIHASPAHGGGPFGGPGNDGAAGLSILDFGLRYQGYATDVTMTVVRGRMTDRQKTMVGLVEEAYALVEERCRPGLPAVELGKAVEELFSRQGLSMPHSLGHGVGLEVHEPPAFRVRPDNTYVLEPGMILALEPGLYDPELGGVRKENTFLVTDQGCEALTRSRILYLD